jgi:gentisate 1,2-dioxygenase
MKPVLRDYTVSVKPKGYYTKPKIMGSYNNSSIYTKTCVYVSPALKASFIKLKSREQFLDVTNCNSNLFYIVKGCGNLNNISFNQGDVICTNDFANLNAKDDTIIYNVDDSPLMNYYKARTDNDVEKYHLHYTHEEIMQTIDQIETQSENANPNRLGVIFGTDSKNYISNTLWCLMTKTLPGIVQPPHKHNSVALDYCVSGKGYTLLSKTINEDGSLKDPIRINWQSGMVFVTPPGWWHSHHSTDSEPGYIFPVQDAGLHMYLDTLGIEFT